MKEGGKGRINFSKQKQLNRKHVPARAGLPEESFVKVIKIGIFLVFLESKIFTHIKQLQFLYFKFTKTFLLKFSLQICISSLGLIFNFLSKLWSNLKQV